MARRKSNKQVKAMIINLYLEQYFHITSIWFDGNHILALDKCEDYFDPFIVNRLVVGTVSIKANQGEV